MDMRTPTLKTIIMVETNPRNLESQWNSSNDNDNDNI